MTMTLRRVISSRPDMFNFAWLAYCDMLVLKGVFDTVTHSALPVGHSHDDYGILSLCLSPSLPLARACAVPECIFDCTGCARMCVCVCVFVFPLH